MSGNLIKDWVLMSKGIMILEDEHPLGMESCSGDCQACKKCETDGEQIAVTRQGSRHFPPVFYQANYKGKRFIGKSLQDLAKQFSADMEG